MKNLQILQSNAYLSDIGNYPEIIDNKQKNK